MDPITLGLISGGMGAIGNWLTGNQQNKLNKQELAEKIRQFNEQLKLQQQKQQVDTGQAAIGANRQVENSPLRDRLMFNMSQHAGMPGGSFKPRDMFNPGQAHPQFGGINQDELAKRTSQYTPGAGGVNPGVAQQLLDQLGYGKKQPQPQLPRPMQRPRAMNNPMYGGGGGLPSNPLGY